MQARFILVSAFYDGKLKKVGLKFYDTETETIRIVYDDSGFMPYFISTDPLDKLESLKGSRDDIAELQPITLADTIADRPIDATKVIVSDPLAISGDEKSGRPGLRDLVDAHEADIKTYLNYLYDNSLIPGTFFEDHRGRLVPSRFPRTQAAEKLLDKVLSAPDITDAGRKVFTEWVSLFDQPLPTFRILALDIETWNERMYKVPSTEAAEMPIIAVSLVGDDGLREVHVFARSDTKLETPGAVVIRHNTERALLEAVFKRVEEYPFLVTFNGDTFDLPYLHNRGRAMGLKSPFKVRRGKQGKGGEAGLNVGIHIDLYKFHSNKSIQNYVYEGVYHEYTLDAISQALLGESKVEIPTKGDMSALTYSQLLEYSIQDSLLTYKIATRKNQLALKLIALFSRTSMMPMDDVSRHGISTWIKSMFSFQLKERNILIPNKEELAAKGHASTQAMIKGKQYQGGMVVEPRSGIYFDVTVLDFASLYPSTIKNNNLSWETMNCNHEECRSNLVPNTPHWVCKKKQGMTSLLVGTLRDLRVSMYKPLSKDTSVSEDDRELANTVAQALKVYINACFTGDTYLVTPSGIKNIKEFRVGDEVFSVNPNTLSVERDRVIEVQQFQYQGDLYHFKDRRFLDLMVTPNHRMLVAGYSGGPNGRRGGLSAEFRTAEDVFSRTNMFIPETFASFIGNEIEYVSLLPTAQSIGATASVYPDGERLVNWFRRLPADLKSKIRRYGRVYKARTDRWSKFGSCYKIPAQALTEDDVGKILEKGGIVMFGNPHSSKVFARVNAKRLAKLCGWVVSEGSLSTTMPREYPNSNKRGTTRAVTISQSQGKGNPNGERFRGQIAELLDALQISYSSDRRGFYIANAVLYEFMASNCYTSARHTAATKRAPHFIFGSPELSIAFFTTAYSGDGTQGQALYTTKSRQLMEDIVILRTALGDKVHTKFDKTVYRVSFSNSRTILTRASHNKHRSVKKVPYDGIVYCVTTAKNHTVFAGRNGRFVPVGQSYGVQGYDKYGLFCVPVAEATTALGRYAIEKAIDKCKELGMGLLGGDTDSLFIDHPPRERIDQVIAWAHSTMKLDLEVDKVYRLALFTSRKKNYLGVLQNDKTVIKGLSGKKSHSPEFIRDTFKSVVAEITKIRTPADIGPTKVRLLQMAKDDYARLCDRGVPLKELAVHMKMKGSVDSYVKNTPQHVQAAKWLVSAGRDVNEGDTITFVKVRPQKVKKLDDDGNEVEEENVGLLESEPSKAEKKAKAQKVTAKPLEFVSADEVDYEKYKDMFISTFEQVYDALGVQLNDEVLSPPKPEQDITPSSSLDAFWG